MDDAGRVQRREGRQHPAPERDRLRDRQRPAAQPVRERLPLEQLHGDEQLAAVLADLVHLADVRVVDPGRGPGLPAEAPAGRVVRLGDRLHRDSTAEAVVLGREDDAHPALPEPVEDAVAAEVPGIARGAGRGRLAAQPVEQAAQHALA